MKNFFQSICCRLLFVILFSLFVTNSIYAQWTSLSTAGGDLGALCVHNEKLLSAGLSSNLWQTTNQGTTWEATPGYFSPVTQTFDLVSDGITIYASRLTQRIVKSTDNGVTWNQVNNGLPADNYPALLLSGGKVFAGSAYAGVYVSTDGGASWNTSNNGITDLQIYALGGIANTVFAGTHDGKVYRSINGGQVWTDVTPSFSNSDTFIYFITVIDNSVFIGGTGFGTMGLVRSDDWGLSWVQDNEGITAPFDLQAGGIAKIDSFLFVGMYSGGIYKRSINTTTWSLVSSSQMIINAPPVYTSTYYLAVLGMIAQGSTLFAQNAGSGLFRSSDLGATWQQVTSDAGGGGDRRGLALNGDTLYLGGDGAVQISTNNGYFWNTYHANVFGAARISSYAFIDSFVFAGHMNLGYGIRRSTDGGHFWIAKNSGLTTGPSRNINKLSKIGSTLFAGTAAGIYFSTDYGESWNLTAFPEQYVSELHAHGNTLFAFSNFLVSRSTDMGQTWTTVTNGLDPWDWVDITSSGSRLLLAGGGIHTSTDDGVSWTDITGNMPMLQFYSIAASGDTLYTASAFNCYYSVNLGQSWTIIPNTGFPLAPSFRHLLVHGGYIYAGMGESGNLGGAWRIPIPGTTSVELVDNEIPTEFLLMQNYPNPFNPSTNIEFMIPQTGQVELNIYDLLGREVSTLTNEVMSPGTYKVSWDASGLSSGIYFSRLVFDGNQIIKQMLLLK
jgi:photosystem II stability/assembly factor-like uncharacterized protein